MKYRTIVECLKAIKRLEELGVIKHGSAEPEYENGYWYIYYDNEMENNKHDM